MFLCIACVNCGHYGQAKNPNLSHWSNYQNRKSMCHFYANSMWVFNTIGAHRLQHFLYIVSVGCCCWNGRDLNGKQAEIIIQCNETRKIGQHFVANICAESNSKWIIGHLVDIFGSRLSSHNCHLICLFALCHTVL